MVAACLPRQVRIFRLITNKTYERAMFEKACLKLSLDHALLGGSAAKGEAEPSATDVTQMLRCGAYDVLADDNEHESKAFCEADIEQLLAQGEKVAVDGKPRAGGAFSKATFSSEGARAHKSARRVPRA
eukprot:5086908-Pleurochrysis_carterae.AAC.4